MVSETQLNFRGYLSDRGGNYLLDHGLLTTDYGEKTDSPFAKYIYPEGNSQNVSPFLIS